MKALGESLSWLLLALLVACARLCALLHRGARSFALVRLYFLLIAASLFPAFFAHRVGHSTSHCWPALQAVDATQAFHTFQAGNRVRVSEDSVGLMVWVLNHLAWFAASFHQGFACLCSLACWRIHATAAFVGYSLQIFTELLLPLAHWSWLLDRNWLCLVEV